MMRVLFLFVALGCLASAGGSYELRGGKGVHVPPVHPGKVASPERWTSSGMAVWELALHGNQGRFDWEAPMGMGCFPCAPAFVHSGAALLGLPPRDLSSFACKKGLSSRGRLRSVAAGSGGGRKRPAMRPGSWRAQVISKMQQMRPHAATYATLLSISAPPFSSLFLDEEERIPPGLIPAESPRGVYTSVLTFFHHLSARRKLHCSCTQASCE